MKHYKDFLIKLQTLDIKIIQRKLNASNSENHFNTYDLSHENPYLSDVFRNQLRELRELALTDILNQPVEQILFQINRLGEIKELFIGFWKRFYSSNASLDSKQSTELLYHLNLEQFFIVPEISFQNNAIANTNFIDDLQDSIRAREKALIEFEQSVLKVIQPDKEAEKTNHIKSMKMEEATPVFKEGVAAAFYELVKDYFKPVDQPHLKNLLSGDAAVEYPLAFSGSGNQLADAFKQLFESNLIIGCNKVQLISWIIQHFSYVDKGTVKNYSEKYLLDIISSNTKSCQSPILNVRKKEGQFLIVPLQRNNRNNKT